MVDIVKVGTLTVKLNVEPNERHPEESGVDVIYDGVHFMRIGGGKGEVILILAKEIARLRELVTED